MARYGKRIMDLAVLGSILLCVAGCGPVHTTVKPQSGALEKIKSVAVVVPPDGEFTVYYERAKGTATGAILFGLVGAAVSSSYNASEDSKIADALRPQLTDLSCQGAFRTAIARALGESRKFVDVRVLEGDPTETERAKYDAIATFRFVSWGIRLVDQNSPERVTAFVDLQATLQKTGTEAPLWDENVTVIGRETHPLSEFREKPDVTRREVSAVMDDAAYRLANNLIYN